MHELCYGVEILVKTDRKRGEDRDAVFVGMAVERLFDMLETGLHRDPAARQQRELRRMTGEALQRREAVDRGELADRVHPRVEVERREAWSALADLGNAQPHFISHLCERVRRHHLPPIERRLSQMG